MLLCLFLFNDLSTVANGATSTWHCIVSSAFAYKPHSKALNGTVNSHRWLDANIAMRLSLNIRYSCCDDIYLPLCSLTSTDVNCTSASTVCHWYVVPVSKRGGLYYRLYSIDSMWRHHQTKSATRLAPRWLTKVIHLQLSPFQICNLFIVSVKLLVRLLQ